VRLGYPQGVDAFEAYRQELLQRDIEPATRERYLQVGDAFKAWLAGREPTATLAQGFLADLRNRGYRQRSIILYYHVLRQLLTTRGESFKLRLSKPQDVPECPPELGEKAIHGCHKQVALPGPL
jgi:hypothetical protein